MPTTKKPRKEQKNSEHARSKAFENADRVVEVPDGVTLDTDQERTLWRQFTRSRGVDDWRDLDLLMLYRAVKLETKIREAEAALKSEGLIITNARGTQIANPLVNIIDSYVRQQLALSRQLNLMAGAPDPRRAKDNAAAENKARAVKASEGDNVSSLFAKRG